MSSRHQAKLFTVYRIPGFSFFIFFRFQCNTWFQYAISCFAKAYRNNIASNFWQVAGCGSHMSKSFTGYHILLLELISFQKLQHTDNGRSSITSCKYRDFISCNILVDFWYCLAYCILYTTKSKETSMKRSASAHVSLKYRQRIFHSLHAPKRKSFETNRAKIVLKSCKNRVFTIY